ncbi:MAG: pyruvate carboxylase subunit B [Dehalococcoidia bacterium]|nr:pyruvate carboxylase subunit B [Dehalococcoidia bacterium]
MTTQLHIRKGPLRITDTTLRDGHQCTVATRMRTADLEELVSDLDNCGFYSLEAWGGATFDVATRYLAEDPWERLRIFKKLAVKTPLQMLIRGQNLVGYRHYADDLVMAFCHKAAESGIEIFRVFDALNDLRNLESCFKAIETTGKHIQGTVCYSITESHLGGPIFNLEYYVKKAQTLRDMGADSICIKDMAGMIAPMDAFALVKAIKSAVNLPLQLHTHYTSGMASMSLLKAAEAGVDIVDCCLAPLALRASQPAVEPIIVALQGTDHDTGLDINKMFKLNLKLEKMLPKYRDYINTSKFSIIDTEVLVHQIPGGMISNLVEQLREADALDRLDEVFKELPRARKDMGFPPLVTPTSQIIGVQAINNVIFGRYKMITDQVKDYAAGMYGRPPAPMDPEFVKMCLKDYKYKTQITSRPADVLTPELKKAEEATKGIAKNLEDVLTYALYPVTGMRFLKWKYGIEPLADDVVGKSLDDIRKEDDMIKRVKAGQLNELPTELKTNLAPAKTGHGRAYNVYIDDEFFRIEVEAADGSPMAAVTSQPAPAPVARVETPATRPAPAPTPAPAPVAAAPVAARAPVPQPTAISATPSTNSHPETSIKAPMPGILVRYHVKEGDQVNAGDVIVILEAMKMENALPAPITGTIKKLTVVPGLKVTKDQVLAIIG